MTYKVLSLYSGDLLSQFDDGSNVCACERSLSRYQMFKDFQKRILVATNLFGRGMDIERVNIVFNYDMPENSDTYLHRVCSSCCCSRC